MVQNEIMSNIFSKKRGEKYDVAVMYSGGKDSSYLLYLLKKVYGLNVVAVCVDNGYESNNLFDIIKKYTDNIGVELVVVRPSKENFTKFFNTMVVEDKLFAREGVNHVCFVCNNILWCNVAKYASENGIPYVASGLSLAQLSSGRPYPLEPDKMANAIAERSTKQILKNALEGFYQSKSYNADEEFKNFIDGLSGAVRQVTTVYPYIYHQISVDDLKKSLDAYGWCPPNEVDPEKYIASGCEIMSTVVGELEKLKIVTLNEREQAKSMVAAGLIDESDLEFANYDASKDMVDLSSPVISELGIKEFLISKCNEQNRLYIE